MCYVVYATDSTIGAQMPFPCITLMAQLKEMVASIGHLFLEAFLCFL
jgi:hypothetical protein